MNPDRLHEELAQAAARRLRPSLPQGPAPQDPAFPAYQQFLHLGEAGLATLPRPLRD